MKKIIIYYNFALISIMIFSGFFGARNFAELFSAILFFPLGIYFFNLILPHKKNALVIPDPVQLVEEIIKPGEKAKKVAEKPNPKFDMDRRMFIKLIGSAGISLFLLSIFSGKAQGAFFGSVPGPGTISVKDSSGVVVDPAIKHPTDGYNISQLDDGNPAYYGFLEKTGKWFIMREESTGDYRYAKGDSSFSTNWTGRAGLTYGYFDAVF